MSSRRPARLSMISPFSTAKKDPFDVGHHPVHPISTGDIGADDEFSKQVVKAEEKRLTDRMTEIEAGFPPFFSSFYYYCDFSSSVLHVNPPSFPPSRDSSYPGRIQREIVHCFREETSQGKQSSQSITRILSLTYLFPYLPFTPPTPNLTYFYHQSPFKLAADEADKEATRAVKPEIKPHFL